MDIAPIVRQRTTAPATIHSRLPASINPVTFGQQINGYIVVPAFNITDHTDWLGASRLLAQYNYSVISNFNILQLPTRPTDSFVLVVRFRYGNIVYRWKLWEDIGELLYEDLLALGTVILKNFSIEVWSIEGEDAFNPGEIQIPVSLMHQIDTACAQDPSVNLVESEPTQCDLYTPLPFFPPDELEFGDCSAGNDNGGPYVPLPPTDQPDWNPPVTLDTLWLNLDPFGPFILQEDGSYYSDVVEASLTFDVTLWTLTFYSGVDPVSINPKVEYEDHPLSSPVGFYGQDGQPDFEIVIEEP